MREHLPSTESLQIATEATEATKGIAFPDPAAWHLDFDRWRAERCISRSGYDDAGGIGTLLLDFAEWCVAREAVPCNRSVFELLLKGAGFQLKDGFANGLLLRVDIEALKGEYL